MINQSEPSGTLASGMRVRVKQEQDRLGGPRYPGRIGTILRENLCGRRTGGLWYVRLEPTHRAKERVEAFWTWELEILKEGAA
jgi:hypothetical protein